MQSTSQIKIRWRHFETRKPRDVLKKTNVWFTVHGLVYRERIQQVLLVFLHQVVFKHVEPNQSIIRINQKGATSGFEMRFCSEHVTSRCRVPTKTRLESSIKKFNAHPFDGGRVAPYLQMALRSPDTIMSWHLLPLLTRY